MRLLLCVHAHWPHSLRCEELFCILILIGTSLVSEHKSSFQGWRWRSRRSFGGRTLVGSSRRLTTGLSTSQPVGARAISTLRSALTDQSSRQSAPPYRSTCPSSTTSFTARSVGVSKRATQPARWVSCVCLGFEEGTTLLPSTRRGSVVYRPVLRSLPNPWAPVHCKRGDHS